MILLLALLIGILYGTGVYMILRRSIVKLIFGLALLGHASNLLLFTINGIVRGAPPIIAEGPHPASLFTTYGTDPFADPVPQALILTAIVIGFGAQAFAVVLIKRVYRVVGTEDLAAMAATVEQEGLEE